MWGRFDISREDLQEHFSGPSFLAWQRMGNLRGYAGPLPQSYINDQAGRPAWPCHAAHRAAKGAFPPAWRGSLCPCDSPLPQSNADYHAGWP